jgi:hypothetical protein
MDVSTRVSRWCGAYLVSAVVGYALAILGITGHNLARLGALGVEIGIADAWKTLVFDFKGLSPTFGTITKYGSVVWLGFLIAFPTAFALHLFFARFWDARYLRLGLFALAGATSMVAGLAIIDAQYKVSMISGTGGVSGYLAQLCAGAIAGLVFALLLCEPRANGRP